jgi:uncharacterized protein (TIGR02246 family)
MQIIGRALLAATALAVMPIVPAHADDAALLQEAKDRAAIEALMWKYVRALDSLDADGYAAAFTPDGQFGSGQNSEKGAAELKGMIDGLKKTNAERAAKGEPTPAMYHVVMNHTISFVDKDHARYDAYWTTMFAAAKQGEAARVAAVGRSVDLLVRQNGQWLIQSRDVAPK